MVLTKKQEEGLKIAVARYKQGEKYTVISGYAGTGKSTLVKFIIEALGVQREQVCYVAFTGKAAEVLRKKGNENAITLHRLLYEHLPRSNGGFFRKRKRFIPYKVVVADEVSMIPKDMIDLLFTHHCYCLFLGDPFQIPPIMADEDNHLLDNPHIFLDEVMRQATDSEIIRLSMGLRQMKPLTLHHSDEIIVANKKDVNTGMLMWADQIICATNKQKDYWNKEIRKLMGRGKNPEQGDKIIGRRNYWDDIADNGDAFVNGTIGFLDDPQETYIDFPQSFLKLEKPGVNVLMANLKTDDGTFMYLPLDLDMLYTGESSVSWKDSYKLNKWKEKFGDLVPRECDYGYAITGHRAQGSEYDKVLVFEENFPTSKEEHYRWLYTCCTRAASQLVIIMK